MEAFVRIRGIAVPMLQINIDTDQIIPGPEIVRSADESYARWGVGLFANQRYTDLNDHTPNPEFILNREPWSRGTILLADRNFGCGSSREPAPRALRGFGFRVVIAPSFGGIFFGNCFRNGLLPVELPIESVRVLAAQMEAAGGHAQVEVDLESQTVTAPDGTRFDFRTPPVLREMLLQGVDEIALTLSRAPQIDAYRQRDRLRRPWAY